MAYTDEQKQLALTAYTACRNNAVQAAKFCRDHYNIQVSHDQIHRWSRGDQIAPEVRESANEVKLSLADKCEKVANKLLDAILPNIDGATLMQQATAFGIVSDKMLLFRGEANSIQGTVISREEAVLKLAEIIAKYTHDSTE